VAEATYAAEFTLLAGVCVSVNAMPQRQRWTVILTVGGLGPHAPAGEYISCEPTSVSSSFPQLGHLGFTGDVAGTGLGGGLKKVKA